MMKKVGMLVCTRPKKFGRLLAEIKHQVKSTLYVQFLSKNLTPFTLPTPSGPSPLGTKFSPTMLTLYENSSCLPDLDVRVLLDRIISRPTSKISTQRSVEVVYFDQPLEQEQMMSFVDNHLSNRTSGCVSVALDDPEVSADQDEFQIVGKDDPSELSAVDYVVLGGTFDRLHLGHKMLLSEAVLHCRKRLVVGVMDDETINKTKTLWELTEPYETRIAKIKDFLQDIQPNLNFDLVPINDIYGPTKDDPTFQMLVVSVETARGGEKVNEVRVKNNLNPLIIRCVDLVKDHLRCWDLEEEKISSSNGRLRLLGHLINPPEAKPNRPDVPYIIGLTGGIASGKSSVRDKLKNLGAGVVDADQVAHQIYQIGQPGYRKIVEAFGVDILDENTKEINRKKLGGIVFSDRKRLKELNNLVWPETLLKVEELCKNLHEKEGFKIIVIEAALLIEAGWNKQCHEVWTCIVPGEEAAKRIQERNKLTEEEAKARIASQADNLQRVALSNVIFCTMWTHEFTQKQVDRAWNSLQQRLQIR